MGENILGNRVIVQMYEDNLDFYSVEMLLTDECAKNCTLIMKKFNDVFPSEHLRSYKIHDIENFSYTILSFVDFENLVITEMNRLRDGFYYGNKIWI